MHEHGCWFIMMVPTTLFKSVRSSSHEQFFPTCMFKPVNCKKSSRACHYCSCTLRICTCSSSSSFLFLLCPRSCMYLCKLQCQLINISSNTGKVNVSLSKSNKVLYIIFNNSIKFVHLYPVNIIRMFFSSAEFIVSAFFVGPIDTTGRGTIPPVVYASFISTPAFTWRNANTHYSKAPNI